MSVRTPKYRLHKASGQALVQIDGQRIYLGKHGSKESKEKYCRIVAEWLQNGQQPPPSLQATNGSRLSIAELILAFWKHAETYYVKNGEPTREQMNLRLAFRPLRRLYGHSRATDFGPRQLKVVRQTMIDADNTREYINNNIRRIRRMFRWGVEGELIPPNVWHGLQAVSGLRKGRCGVRESEPVEPVPNEIVQQTLPHLTSVVRAMVEVQKLIGCRPCEIRTMRPCEVDRVC